MAYLTAAPELVVAAATDLANIGSTIDLANEAAALPTTGVLAAGADEVSAGIASLFGAHAQAYQALSTQAARFHAQFVQLAGGHGGAATNDGSLLDGGDGGAGLTAVPAARAAGSSARRARTGRSCGVGTVVNGIAT